MTLRILPRKEWVRLAHTELEHAWAHLPPASTIVVVEEGETIVGCWAVAPYVHVEGLWVHPDHRLRGRVGYRLLGGMVEVARSLGVDRVLTCAMSDEVRALLAHVGATPLPGEHYVLPLGGS
jgi:N-acetylglutamate synthase-like GNAT family acetyltransferase